jgi:hypothetical protein
MKNRSFSGSPYYFFKRRIPFNKPYTALVLMTPCSKLKKNKDIVENIPQWEDDGGRIIDASHSIAGVSSQFNFYYRPAMINQYFGVCQKEQKQWIKK